MNTVGEDLIELFDWAWNRFTERMSGLTDDEWQWRPTADRDLSLDWRLAHLSTVLGDEHNGVWLGVPSPMPPAVTASTADEALAGVTAAYQRWRGQVRSLTDGALAEAMGPVAGPYAQSTKRSFVLHVVDEFIHHSAEAATLRDLYARRDG